MKLGKNPNRKRMRRERERKKQQLIIVTLSHFFIGVVTLSHWHCFLLFSLLLGSPPLCFVEVVMLKVLFFPHSHSLSIFLFYTYFFFYLIIRNNNFINYVWNQKVQRCMRNPLEKLDKR